MKFEDIETPYLRMMLKEAHEVIVKLATRKPLDGEQEEILQQLLKESDTEDKALTLKRENE